MTATQAIQIRVSVAQARALKRAAKFKGQKLATFVREVAVSVADGILKSEAEQGQQRSVVERTTR